MSWPAVTSAKAPLTLKGTYRFWSNICCHPEDVFFRDVPAYFSETMLRHIVDVFQKSVFVVKEFRY